MDEIIYWLFSPVPGLEDASKSWVGAAIMGATAIASLIGNAIKNKKEQNRTNRANMELAKYQAQQNEALIDKQNEYNTPVNQQMRFDAAGLNPNLMYGQGSPGNQTQAAKYEAPTLDYRTPAIDFPSVISEYQDFQMKQAQIENIEASTSNVMEQNMLRKLQGRRGELQFSREQNLSQFDVGIRRAEKLKLYRQLNLLEAETARTSMRDRQVHQQIEGADYDLLFKRYEKQFREQGFQSSDHVGFRVLIRMLNRIGLSPDELFGN